MPERKHAVPQHIMGVEFKLIGDLTIRQFVFLVAGGALAFLALRSPLPFLWKWGLIILGGGLGLGLAFLPLQERSLDQWIVNFLRAVFFPTQRVWRKSPPPPAFLSEALLLSLKKEAYSLVPRKERWRLEKYLEKLERERPKSELDFAEEEFLKSLDFALAPPPSVVEKAPPPPEIEKVEKVTLPERKVEVRVSPTLASEINWAAKRFYTIPIGAKKRKYVTTLTTVRPGRKLHTLPTIEGEIVMPIRGEKVFEPEEPKVVEKEKEKEKRLRAQIEVLSKRLEEAPALPYQKQLERLRAEKEELGRKIQREGDLKRLAEELSGKNVEYQRRIRGLLTQNEKLSGEMREIQKEMERLRKYTSEVTTESKEVEERLRERETRLQALMKEKEKAGFEMRRLQEKLLGEAPVERPHAEKPRVVKPRPPKKGRPKIIGDIPNVVNGIVKDASGNILENAIVIVKDADGDPVRALKTNKLGQFAISTPLPNGLYTVSVESGGLKFDIMEVSIVGEVLPPLEFVGKSS